VSDFEKPENDAGVTLEAEGYPLPDQNLGLITRILLLATGWFFVVLGIIGIFLPVLPTTPLLLISLWAFSRSSPRLHNWLYTHPRAGPYLVAWSRYHVIPLRAKILAVSLMTLSWCYVTFFIATSWIPPIVLGVTMAAVFSYILTKPNEPPAQASGSEQE
jgi:uncharacterized membrane protein YbaN (DUF454 family)